MYAWCMHGVMGMSVIPKVIAHTGSTVTASLACTLRIFLCDLQADKPVLISGSPSAPSTHQQQLFLNFPKSIRLAKGDALQGTLSWRPGGVDGRGVVIELQVDYKGVVATASYTLSPFIHS